MAHFIKSRPISKSGKHRAYNARTGDNPLLWLLFPIQKNTICFFHAFA